MLFFVIAYCVYATVQSVSSQVHHVNITGLATHQRLQFGLVEHREPRGLDDLSQALQEGVRLQGRLYLKPVAGDVRYVY